MKEAIKENLKKTKRIFFEALPEIWSYKIWTYFIIAILIAVIKRIAIKLKGVTADRQMVDDIVRIVKEKDCVNDVVLISLKSDVIYYAEEKYSEMETGVLIYGGFGDIQNFNADWILMEEELAELVFRGNNEKSKKYGIWTVNNEVDMRKSFDYGMEGIITDDLDLYDSMKEKMDKRTDFQIIENWNNTLID